MGVKAAYLLIVAKLPVPDGNFFVRDVTIPAGVCDACESAASWRKDHCLVDSSSMTSYYIDASKDETH
jgi:hypothetical protein